MLRIIAPSEVWMWLWAIIGSMASATPCDPAFAADDVVALMDRAEQALTAGLVQDHARAFSELRERAECLGEPIPVEAWTRMLVTWAIVQHALERPWREPLVAAMQAWPEVDRTWGPPDIRDYPQPTVDETHWIPVSDDGQYFLDGKQVDRVPPGVLTGPRVVQSYADERWETIYQQDKPYPGHWLSIPEDSAVSKRRSVTVRMPTRVVVGIGLSSAGLAAGVGTWAATRNREYASRGQESALKLLNVAGWSAVGAGGGLLAFHVIGGSSISVGSQHIAVGGVLP